jgi:hypothetical protein
MGTRLANDIARCDGVFEEGEWREGCEGCLRRTAPRPEFVTMFMPPPITEVGCE